MLGDSVAGDSECVSEGRDREREGVVVAVQNYVAPGCVAPAVARGRAAARGWRVAPVVVIISRRAGHSHACSVNQRVTRG